MTFSEPNTFEQYLHQLQPKTKTSVESRRESMEHRCRVQQGTVEMSKADLENTIPAHVTPLDDRGQLGSPTRVELSISDGRDVSFHHQLPLSTRRAFVSVEDEHLGSWEAMVDLSWCRFNRRGYYTSGGRFAEPAMKTA